MHELAANLDGRGFEFTNITITNSVLNSVGVAKIGRLFVNPLITSTLVTRGDGDSIAGTASSSRVLLMDSTGEVVFLMFLCVLIIC